jgi:proteasome lid subunit RPN8/RPN11
LKVRILIPNEFLRQIKTQAEKDYPNETCGILTGPKNQKWQVTGIYPCHNAQDEYHALDPANFPRTAQSAYFIDPKELLRIQKDLRQKEEEMRVIYHSHVNAGAYFSDEDQRIALCEGNPAYPGVLYLVISVRDGKAQETALFDWDGGRKQFSEKKVKV